MGYTHYWEFSDTLATVDKDTAEKISDAIHKVIKQHRSILEVDATTRAFYINGKGDNSHETFVLSSYKGDFNFCKTARKPYDIVVCKVLLILKHYLGDGINVSSDGFSTWQRDDKKYKVGDRVLLKDLDGTWGKAARAINRQLKTKLHFIVDNVYGDGDRYFSYKLRA